MLRVGPMDNIGIDRLIEMIDERMGKPVGTIVLYLVVAAIVAVSLHAIGTYFVVPASEILDKLLDVAADPITQSEIARSFLGVAVLVATWAVLFALGQFLTYRLRGRLETQLAKAEDYHARAKAATTAAEHDIERIHRILVKMKAAVKNGATRDEMLDALDAIDDDGNWVNQDEATDTQSPQGIESKTPQ